MRDRCPKCITRHRKFPRTCYYAVHADNAHCVIAKLASLGTPQQTKFARDSAISWAAMDAYARRNFADDVKSLEPKDANSDMRDHCEQHVDDVQSARKSLI